MSVRFSPVAIVGRACVLPGALSPEQLWQALANGRDLLSSAPAGRWNMPHGSALCSAEDSRPDCAWSDRGGYVSGFESVWDPQGFAVPAEQLDGLDPLMHWTLHCGREALRQARAVRPARSGAIFGNLGFPSAAMAAFAQSVWTGEGQVDPRNRFMSSGSAELLRLALELGVGSFCLDAACASSLYAIKLACDQLHDGKADLMLAGAVQRADDLFLHVGFSALNALSRSGQSRPFHSQADGLVPAEGAAFLALKRLEDARRDGDRIHGVIRGIGLSNDGRGKGLLVPAEEGQRRAIRAAFDGSGLSPKQISLLECHATGTPVGDATEVRSSAAEFTECEALPIGSLKSNLGHLITTAGAAAIIKVLEAMRHAQRPPTLHVEAPNPALQNTPFRLLTELEPWSSEGPRCAAISAFGFGGNNAHLLLSEESDEIELPAPALEAPSIAVVALGGRVGRHADRGEFSRHLFSTERDGEVARAETIEVDLQGLRVPPNDLAQALPQQLGILQASREALDDVSVLPSARCAAYIGMEPDPEVARYGLRWRLAAKISDSAELVRQRDAVVPALQSAAVLGTMPNIPANRLSSQFDLRGPAFTVQAGADSGLVALLLAARALRQGEIDAALVGAVDFSCEPVHQAALPGPAADAALVWVLKRQGDAVRDGDQIYALLDSSGLRSANLSTLRMGDAEDRGEGKDGGETDGDQANATDPLLQRYGRAFAAHRMLQLSAAALALHHRRRLDGQPWLSADPRRASIHGNSERSVSLIEAGAWVAASEPCATRLHCYSGADRGEVIAALQTGRESQDGPARLVLLSEDQQLATQRNRALAHLQSGAPAGSTIFFRERPLKGGLGFVFAGAGAAYTGMGRELLLQLPQLQDRLALRSRRLALGLDWALAGAGNKPSSLQQLQGASALCQLHAEFSRHVLGLRADAWLGYSSGETNALFAAGVWNDPDALLQEMEQSGLMSRELGGEFNAIARAWGSPVRWANWSVLAPLEEVRAALEAEPKVHLAIINSDQDCMIAGEAEACARIIDQLGRSRCLPVDYALAAHVPELALVEDEWLRLHRRACQPPRSGQVYSNAWGRSYTPDSEQCAQAILQQANRGLDLRPAILQAWADGIRIFVEHGPGSTYSRAIRSVLGEREALVLSLDRRGQGIEGLLASAAALLAAGVAIDLDQFHAALGAHQANPVTARRLRVPAHAADIVLTPTSRTRAGRNEPEHAGSRLSHRPQRMPPAPALPSVLAVASPGAAANAERRRVQQQIAAAPVSRATLSAGASVTTSATAAVATTRTTPASSRQTAALSAHLAQIAQLQQTFLREQAAAQQRFLGLRATALQTLLQAASAPGADILITSPGVTATSAGQSAAVTASMSASEAPGLQAAAAALGDDTAAIGVAVAANDAPVSATTSRSMRPTVRGPHGPTFDRAALEIHAGGRISTLFGAQFSHQDDYQRQVRMPQPPLLLADRVAGIEAEPDSMGKGIIWTETDVGADAWYLHHGRMPAGVMIEAGQADLMLISYLGVDRLNRGQRVYRLLGCELTYHGDLPASGETLRFEIALDGHAAQGDVRLMFFHYDCHNGDRLQLSVRKGQAGFFSDAELADSAGCLWRAEEQSIVATPQLNPPAVIPQHRQFDRTALQAFAEGKAYDCFGSGFEFARTHTRSPSIHAGRMLLQDRVSEFDPAGGPWQRGYLRAELDIHPQQWFFEGHFKNDPCMPGTLMFEGCLQMLAFYLAACGFTLPRDGWRFQPVPELPYQLQCRGQVLPSSRLLVTEVFVEELIAGPIPTVYADLLCTVDGLKAFHARRVALQLVPDWPLSASVELLAEAAADKAPCAEADGFRFDRHSLLACALGRPSQAFGPMYRRFDGPTRVARLPSPPYHFISRIAEVQGPIGEMRAGARVITEYDLPADVWYLDQNGCRRMPFAVLLEAALQPCGWLSSYVGSALSVDEEVGFRNLDGDGVVLAELEGGAGVLRTEVELKAVSATAGMIIETFSVHCSLDDRSVYRLNTVFGFFPPAALAAQAGLPSTAAQRELLQRPGNLDLDLAALSAAQGPQQATLPGPMLRMLDRLEGYWPEAGEAGLGQLRAVKQIDSGEWFFKAHFFQDPVQPGSLGLEAMLQLLQLYLLQSGACAAIVQPRFECIALQRPHQWKYRGQVLPQHRQVHTTLEITERGVDERGAYAVGTASLWADGQRIYEAQGLAVRVVSGAGNQA